MDSSRRQCHQTPALSQSPDNPEKNMFEHYPKVVVATHSEWEKIHPKVAACTWDSSDPPKTQERKTAEFYPPNIPDQVFCRHTLVLMIPGQFALHTSQGNSTWNIQKHVWLKDIFWSWWCLVKFNQKKWELNSKKKTKSRSSVKLCPSIFFSKRGESHPPGSRGWRPPNSQSPKTLVGTAAKGTSQRCFHFVGTAPANGRHPGSTSRSYSTKHLEPKLQKLSIPQVCPKLFSITIHPK